MSTSERTKMQSELSGVVNVHDAPTRIFVTEHVCVADLALGSLRAAPPATR